MPLVCARWQKWSWDIPAADTGALGISFEAKNKACGVPAMCWELKLPSWSPPGHESLRKAAAITALKQDWWRQAPLPPLKGEQWKRWHISLNGKTASNKQTRKLHSHNGQWRGTSISKRFWSADTVERCCIKLKLLTLVDWTCWKGRSFTVLLQSSLHFKIKRQFKHQCLQTGGGGGAWV